MTRSLTFAAALIAVLGAGCSGPPADDAEATDTPPEPPTSPVLRLDLTNETAEASGPRETVVLLEVPADWRTRESFSGSWSQPPEAPTLMLVASSYDDGRRTGEYAAERTEEGISVNLHRNWADNNVELSFVMEAGAGAGRWGHSTFAGHREKGPVEVSLTGE